MILSLERKKLGGILTELSADTKTGLVEYAIVGVGINCLQREEDFPAQLREMAASLSMVSGKQIQPPQLAAAMTQALFEMSKKLFSEKDRLMASYKEDCITLGKDIVLLRADQTSYGKALDMDSDGGLVVAFEDGTVQTVSSGEVSVRGMYGYL